MAKNFAVSIFVATLFVAAVVVYAASDNIIEEIGLPPKITSPNNHDDSSVLVGRSPLNGNNPHYVIQVVAQKNNNPSGRITYGSSSSGSSSGGYGSSSPAPAPAPAPSSGGSTYGASSGGTSSGGGAAYGSSGGGSSSGGYGSSGSGGGGGLLNGTCASNGDCSAIPNSQCATTGVCACLADFVALGNTDCVGIASNFGDNCVVPAQCQPLGTYATCYDGKCICEPIYHVAATDCPTAAAPVTGGTTAYDYLSAGTFSAATMAAAATAAPDIVCLSKKKLGEQCCNTRQCMYKVWHSSCNASTTAAVQYQYALTGGMTCQCDYNYVPIGALQCAPLATSFASPCSVNPQCREIVGANCEVSGFCECHLPEYCYADAATASALASLRSGIVARRRRQTANTVAIDNPPTCYPVRTLGQTCSQNNQCSNGTRNTNCTSGVCVCNSGFTNMANVSCVPTGVLGSLCVMSAQCTQANTTCSMANGVCVCTAGFRVQADSDSCQALAAFGAACAVDGDCATAGAICLPTTAVCGCPTGDIHITAPADQCALPLAINPAALTINCCPELSNTLLLTPTDANYDGTVMFALTSGQDSAITINSAGVLMVAATYTPVDTPGILVTGTATSSTTPAMTASFTVTVSAGTCCDLPTPAVANSFFSSVTAGTNCVGIQIYDFDAQTATQIFEQIAQPLLTQTNCDQPITITSIASAGTCTISDQNAGTTLILAIDNTNKVINVGTGTMFTVGQPTAFMCPLTVMYTGCPSSPATRTATGVVLQGVYACLT